MDRFLIIAGGRDFNNYLVAYSVIDRIVVEILENGDNLVIIEGGAKGADRIGREYAQEHGIPFITKEADWFTYGRAAGPIRNEIMAKMGTDLIAFWDGQSRGTKHMIKTAESANLNVHIHYYS